MPSLHSQDHAPQGMPPPTTKKRATAEEIQADLRERIERYFAREGRPDGCEATPPRLLGAREAGGPNWTVDGFPGLPNGCFGALVRILDQARQEYELIS